MEFTRGNLAIREHSKDGRALHLFRSLGKGKGQQYVGEYVYASHRLSRGPDKDGNERQLIIFELVPVVSPLFLEAEDDSNRDEVSTNSITLAEARTLALAAANASTDNHRVPLVASLPFAGKTKGEKCRPSKSLE